MPSDAHGPEAGEAGVPQLPNESDRVVLVSFVNQFNLNRAWLPEDFELAKQAIAALTDADAVKELIDKSKAMEAYAREIKDGEQMRDNLRKVIIRAWKRLGELYLVERTSPKGGRPPKTPVAAGVSEPRSARNVGRKLGHDRHQVDKAINIAKVPTRELDEAIEAGESETAVAKRGRCKRPSSFDLPKSEECQNAKRLLLLLEHTKKEAAIIDVIVALNEINDGKYHQDHSKVRDELREAASWWAWVRDQAEQRGAEGVPPKSPCKG